MPIRDWDNVLSFVSSKVETPKERRAAITSFVPDMIEEGINQTQAHRLFRDYGLGINDRSFADIYQSFSRDNELFSELSTLDPDDQIAENLMTRNVNFNDRRFRWEANVGYESREGDRFYLGTFSFGADENMSIADIEEQFRDVLSSYYGVDAGRIHTVRINRAYINPDPIF